MSVNQVALIVCCHSWCSHSFEVILESRGDGLGLVQQLRVVIHHCNSLAMQNKHVRWNNVLVLLVVIS
jgi:hypothetical protein